MVQIAIARKFFSAYSKIPKSKQKKVEEFISKFMENPTQRSINYEPIYDMKDDKVRTVRIDSSYRAIVIHPPKGNVYLLVWVDHHDEAMNWAKNKVFNVNPETGALQVIDMDFVQSHGVETPLEDEITLFSNWTDEELELLGVPKIILPAVRAIKDEKQLELLYQHIPEEAYEGLQYLVMGCTIDETLEVLCYEKRENKIDPDDYEAALNNHDTKRRFAVFTSSSDLMEVLHEPLALWRIYLHPYQKLIVEGNNGNYNGAVRITGGPGTGKTVVAMHRAKYLADNWTCSQDKILFTTFTRNLAKSIQENLDNLCSRDSRDRIEVINIHSWAVKFMRSQGVYFNIANAKQVDEYWQRATEAGSGEFNLAFYKDEWEGIVQVNGIESKQQYLRTPRIGRGVRLSREQREDVWKVIEIYRQLLHQANKVEWLDVIIKTREFIEQYSVKLPYKAIIVDEAQDFHSEEFKLLRKMIPDGMNDLFIVGDSHQRIYNRKVVLRQCGIEVRGRRSKCLKLNYRTTEEIRLFASRLLSGEQFDDLDGGLEDNKGYTSLLHGAAPQVEHFQTYFDEVKFIAEYIKLLSDEGNVLEDICIVARHKDLLANIYKPALQFTGIRFVELEGNESNEGEGVRLATMHRVKGLEFKHMIIASANRDIIPSSSYLENVSDDITKGEIILRERSLLYVAATRARDGLLITSYGEQSEFLDSLSEDS